ncbi:MAG: MMPL family transporter [Candidatus Aminicenantes bacterium]|nr:MMPL family transporter [Candidatus Aminicenantes bacterium]NIM83514.1 MMPL family transporter [Candidatus Aminicenantes bacterium]NIN22903.1 MMPL family transporter [Candidatus Aminicenantes bacterium]NIN46642.1 MMPL family transporter [Candidatus Aminicenantes bacterium]NIN89545.1 MMPL family transporter [Candidatus Aminicenantes bacterium]
MNKIFENFVAFVCKHSLRHPLLWIMAALVLSIPAILQFSHVGLDTDLIRLLPEDSRATILKKQVDEIVTGSGGFFTILLESPDKEKLTRALEAAVSKVKNVKGVGALEYRNPVNFYKKYRYALVPAEFLDRILDFFIRLEARVNPMGEDLLSDVDETEEEKKEKEEKDKKDIKKMMRYLDLPEFHQSENGEIMAVKVFPQKGITSLGKTKRMLTQLTAITDEISRQYGVWGGVGGSLRNDIDQYDFIITDLARSGTITLVTVLLALIIGFRSIRVLPVVLLPLALGLIWTLGSIPVIVGDLNTITSFLLLVSFGLGIDFSIHLVKRFQHELKQKPPEDALPTTFRSTGKSILVSGLTTSLALFILAFSNFRGFSEFGIVGAYSLIMILLAMILFLPSICVLGVKFGLVRKLKDQRRSNVLVPVPAVTLIILLVIAASLALGGVGLTFNYDFSKMEVKVPQEQEIKDRFYQVYESVRSPAALFVSKGLKSLDELTESLKKKKDVEMSRIERFHSILEICPDNNEFQERLDLIDEIKEVIAGRWINRVEDEDYKKWISDMRGWIPPPHQPKPDDLPKDIRNRFSSQTHPDHYIIPVYIKGDKQKGKNAMAFADELYNVKAPDNTIGPFGETTVLADVLRVVTSEGPWLVAFAFLGIFLIILMGQRSFLQTLWIVLPLITGIILTAGIMVVLGMRLNFFNVVVFPTLIGMGVDDGVHYYRRWRERGMDTSSTQRELFGPLSLTSITTMFGYIGIAFSGHPGLQSIGILACIGLFATWFTTLFLLPGLLNLFSHRGHRE